MWNGVGLLILIVWVMPVGNFSKLLRDVPDGKLPPLKYQEVCSELSCVVGAFPLMLMVIVSEVVKGRDLLFGVGLM